jgi:putative sterol carrier protein
MADATAEFFGELGRRGHEPLLEKATGTVRFDLEQGSRTEHWLVAVKKGDVVVSRENAEADCVFRTERELFDLVVGGEMNAMAALLRGAMSVEGDRELLVLFQRLLPGPPSSRQKRPADRPAGMQS